MSSNPITPAHVMPYCQRMIPRGQSFHACCARPAKKHDNGHNLCGKHYDMVATDGDVIAATELRLWADHDGSLYRAQGVLILRNLGKKFRAGIYDEAKARGLWYSWATNAAKRYAREFASAGEWAIIFPPAVRRDVAEAKEAGERAEFELGNFVEGNA